MYTDVLMFLQHYHINMDIDTHANMVVNVQFVAGCRKLENAAYKMFDRLHDGAVLLQDHCETWARAGQCNSNAGYMIWACQLTCGFCRPTLPWSQLWDVPGRSLAGVIKPVVKIHKIGRAHV